MLVLLALGISAAGFWVLGGDEPPAGEGMQAASPGQAASPETAHTQSAPPQGSPSQASPTPGAGTSAARLPAPPQRRAEQDRGYDRCMALALADPEQGVAEAQRWRAEGGGEPAAHCEAVARLRAGDGEGAAQLLEALGRGAFAPGDARASLFAQASQIWLEAGEFPRAYAAITQALILRPDDPDMLTDRAVIAASDGRFEEAIEDLTRVIDLRPIGAEPYVLRASAWRQLGQAALARDDVARALAKEPLNQEAWLESGFLKREANDMAGARRDWEQTVRIGPDTTTAALAARNITLLTVLPDGALRLGEPAGAAPATGPSAPAAAAARGAATPLPRPPPSPPTAPR
jgi:tetratricopeptide (TPR) repeat protein